MSHDIYNSEKADQSVKLVEGINPEPVVKGPTKRVWYVRLSQDIKLTRKGVGTEPSTVHITLESGKLVPLARVLADRIERYPYVCAVGGGFPFFRLGRKNALVFEDVPRGLVDAATASAPSQAPVVTVRKWYSAKPEHRVGY